MYTRLIKPTKILTLLFVSLVLLSPLSVFHSATAQNVSYSDHRGRVVDAQSGKPIPHARVTHAIGGQADDKGRFTVRHYSSDTLLRVIVSHPGYYSDTFSTPPVYVALRQIPRSLRHPLRPKVAVVLSGGGAKGVAHISALKVIEEAGIPIDIVCGTSMGALIGGLYSIGWTPEELDSLVRVQDWPLLLSDRVAPENLNLSQRKRQNIYAYSRTFGLSGATAKGGFIRGSNLDQLFHTLCYGFLDSADFNTFPVRFACVATDIVTNTEVDFHSGHLPQAMRASMAIPGVFTPVRIGDSVLVDGGMRNNYPADLARKMGAQIIIGVDVQDEKLSADEIGDAMSVFSQIIDNNTRNKYSDNVAASDIYIRVPVKGYSAASFTATAVDTLLRRGEIAARQQWDSLLALRRRYHIDSTARDIPPHPSPSDNNRRNNTVRQYFSHTEVGVGFRFDSEEAGALQLGTLIPYGINNPMMLDLSIRLGKRIVFHAEQQFFPNGWYNPSLAYSFAYNDIDVYSNGIRSFNAKYFQHTLDFAPINTNFRRFAIRAGVRWNYFNFPSPILTASDSAYNIPNQHFPSYQFQAVRNTENDWYAPITGHYIALNAAYHTDNFISYQNAFGPLEIGATLRTNLLIARRLTIQPSFFGRWILSNNTPTVYSNFIGPQSSIIEQQLPFPGLHGLNHVGNHLNILQLKLQFQILNKRYIILSAAAGLHFQHLNEVFPSDASASQILNNLKPNLYGIQLGYLRTTFLGPLSAYIGYSNIASGLNFYLNIGHYF